jgi:hypothetical protein
VKAQSQEEAFDAFVDEVCEWVLDEGVKNGSLRSKIKVQPDGTLRRTFAPARKRN